MDTKSESSFQTKLNQLHEFIHPLVYNFMPETSPAAARGSVKFEDTMFSNAGQHEDLLNAYLFAQNTLLPWIKRADESFKANLFLDYIKQLHGYIANTLIEDLNIPELQAGKFSKGQLYRWKPSWETGKIINAYLNVSSFKMDITQTCKEEVVKILTQDLKMTDAEVNNFLDLLEGLKSSKISVRPSQKPYNDLSQPGGVVAERLAVAHLQGLFTEEQKALIAKVVTICRDPLELPQAMQAFADNHLQRWNACDKNNLDEVTACLAEMFYEFTDIHPFPNGNGRTATCLVNLFLRSIDQPSILLRLLDERSDANSSYSKAISAINESRAPLAKHLKMRIEEANSTLFSDPKRRDEIVLRCDLTQQLKLIKAKYPRVEINNYYQKMTDISKEYNSELMKLPSQTDQINFMQRKSLVFLKKEEQRLEALKPEPKFLDPVKLTEDELRAVKANLASLSQNEGWKANHSKAWLQLNDRSVAIELANALKATGVATVSLKRGANFSVIECTNINHRLLEEKTSQKQQPAAEVFTA